MHPKDSGIRIAWLMEPRAINAKIYNDAWMRRNKYDYIISHDLAYLEKFDEQKRVFCPGSGSSLYEYEWKIYPKTKSILTVVGDKWATEGHKLRHVVAKMYEDRVSVMGRGYKPFPPEKRAEVYAPYRFQIVIHNSAVEDYWTDILLDCFLTGTVPIVWKGAFLEKYFNMDGILTFTDPLELGSIIHNLDIIYNKPDLQKAIQDNFKRAKKLAVVEDYLYDNFFKQFDETQN
jgi:hypothetical protein